MQSRGTSDHQPHSRGTCPVYGVPHGHEGAGGGGHALFSGTLPAGMGQSERGGGGGKGGNRDVGREEEKRV